VHHIGLFDGLEDEYCWWVPGTGESPNRLDAAVWALTKLLLVKRRRDPVWGKRPGKVGRERAV
jgi:phage terminase large subunit-like protein